MPRSQFEKVQKKVLKLIFLTCQIQKYLQVMSVRKSDETWRYIDKYFQKGELKMSSFIIFILFVQKFDPT